MNSLNHNTTADSALENERNFHNQRFGGEDGRAGLAMYYSINESLLMYYRHQVLSVCREADLLEYGCGTGETSVEWARHGAKVTGIDLSDEGIRRARELAAAHNLDIRFLTMNAEDLRHFQARSFDIVTGVAILHHLNVERAYSELARVLRRDGRAVFVEPLGHNVFINVFRKLTPSLRTKDEHPLRITDLRAARRYFGEVRIRHFFILTLLAIPFRRLFFFDELVSILNCADRCLMFLLPFTRRYAWQVVMRLSNPR